MKKLSLIVIQCRYNSSRLLGKALYPLVNIPILVFLIRRLKESLDHNSFRIVLATSIKNDDNIIGEWGKSENIPVIRGSKKDVLKRYIQSIKVYPCKTIVRVTADNPLTCPEIIKWLINEQQNKCLDYVFCSNLPYGAGVDVFSYNVLETLDKKKLSNKEREHINLHILNNRNIFKTSLLQVSDKRARPDISLTIDTFEDWLKLNSLFHPNEIAPWRISLNEAINRMDKNYIQRIKDPEHSPIYFANLKERI